MAQLNPEHIVRMLDFLTSPIQFGFFPQRWLRCMHTTTRTPAEAGAMAQRSTVREWR